MKKKILIFLVIISFNTILSYFIILGLNSFDKINSNLLIKAFAFALLSSLGILYSITKKKK